MPEQVTSHSYRINNMRVTWLNRDAGIAFVIIRYVRAFEGIPQERASKRYICGPDGFECVTGWSRANSDEKRAVEAHIALGTWRES